MTYELAKQLKEVGFPQCEGKDSLDCPCLKKSKRIRYPSLKKLIEALPSFYDFRLGYKLNIGPDQKKEWEAIGFWRDFTDNTRGKEIKGKGNNPEEAVANLWLALNKK